MASLPRIAAADIHRVRRFDAVVLGGALPGLVAAIRLAQRGARVLVVEEEAAARAHPGWREPFLLWDAEPGGVLGSCLRALAVPLIDQRRLVADDMALQLVTPHARLDWGRAPLAAAELTAWGFAKPDEARALLGELAAAAEATREALLAGAGPRVRGAGPRATGASTEAPPRTRGPSALGEAAPSLRELLRDVARALSEEAGLPAEPAALRMLGALLGGGAIVAGEGGLRELLWRRLATLFGERRQVPGPFRLVAASHLAAVEVLGVQEIWAGRALLLNAPREALAQVHDGPAPALLRSTPSTHRRVGIHLRAPSGLLPEAMARRLVVHGEGYPLRIARHAGPRASARDDLFVSTVAPRDAEVEVVYARLERVVDELAPFCSARIERRPAPGTKWDRDDLLHAAAQSAHDPGVAGTRLSSRPLVVALERELAAAYGFEGELLHGWRAGDELLAELG